MSARSCRTHRSSTRGAWSSTAPGSRRPSRGSTIACSSTASSSRRRRSNTSRPTSDYQRRGLVAAQMQWHHDACLDAGIGVQMIGGIPYFYRRFGYGYGLEDASLFLFDRAHVDAVPAPALPVRRATPHDLDEILRLEDERPTDGLRVVRDERSWRRVLAHVRRQRVGRHLRRRGGRAASAVGFVSSTIRTSAGPSCCPRWRVPPRRSRRWCGPPWIEPATTCLIGFDSPGTVFADQLRVLAIPFVYGLGYYVRIPGSRSRSSSSCGPCSRAGWPRRTSPPPAARSRSRSTPSASRSTTRTVPSPPYADPWRRGPTDVDGIGVAPDWFPALALGRWKATELARRVDDVLDPA